MAPKTRLEATDEIERKVTKGKENDIDTSSSVLGKRDRSMAGRLAMEQNRQQVEETSTR